MPSRLKVSHLLVHDVFLGARHSRCIACNHRQHSLKPRERCFVQCTGPSTRPRSCSAATGALQRFKTSA